MRRRLPAASRLAILIRSGIVLSALLVGAAHAHQDTILHLGADGRIAGIPAKFGAASLRIPFSVGKDGKPTAFQLTIGQHRTILPDCVLPYLAKTSLPDIHLSGSWYHEESGGLPFYLGVNLYERGYSNKRSFNSHIHFLFNLRTGELLHVGRRVAMASDMGEEEGSMPGLEKCLAPLIRAGGYRR